MMIHKYKPAGHRVIIKLDSVIEGANVTDDKIKTKSGFELFLPKDEKSLKIDEAAMDTGIVVSIGKKAWYKCHDGEPWAKLGDKVVFNRYCGTKFSPDKGENQYRVIEDTDIQMIIEE